MSILKKNIPVGLASDHAGFEMKQFIKQFLIEKGIEIKDFGTFSCESVDYPDFAKSGVEKILEDKNNVGIFICGSGIGMSMAANRNPKIRAALCLTPEMAMLARKDNDANVLCLGSRFIKRRKAIAIIKVFLTTPFEGGRHARRVKKISGDIK